MPILPLPQFEADLEEDRKIYERLKPPTSIVVRFGAMKMVGEFPYSGDAKPGCGSKLVVRTHRGTELAEMLTSTCPNAGCSKSVTRKEMLQYIENSGGRDYPFFNQGKVLRLATAEDLNEHARLESAKPHMVRAARAISERMHLPMKIVEAEPILGNERLTFHFTSEHRVDFRELVAELAAQFSTRIEMHQVGARDEARLIADYEKCGQHCCCKQFLKVLKPISMKSAKIQKATLDPLKISGRCGRLMCCLRYEDSTYDELRARLPKKKINVQTPHGWGLVLDTQILTQLVLVQLFDSPEQVAVPVEELTNIGGTPPPPSQAAPTAPPPRAPREPAPPRPAERTEEPSADQNQDHRRRRRRGRDRREGAPSNDAPSADRPTAPADTDQPPSSDNTPSEPGADAGEPRRRRRRRRGRGGGGGGGGGETGGPPPQGPPK